MKRNKTICIDEDIIEELDKVKNSSGMINKLLREFFKGSVSYKKEELLRKEKELRIFIEEKEEEIKSIKARIENVDREEKRVAILFKELPKEILDDFKTFPDMTEVILEQRIREIYSTTYPQLNYKLIWNAFAEFYKERIAKENTNAKL